MPKASRTVGDTLVRVETIDLGQRDITLQPLPRLVREALPWTFSAVARMLAMGPPESIGEEIPQRHAPRGGVRPRW
jgi:hypothetical protein